MASHTSPLFLGLLICFACLHCCWCQATPNCSSTAPTTCSFDNTFCVWEATGWQKFVNRTTANTANNNKATLRSDLACSPQRLPRCLSFEFLLSNNSRDTYLNVVLEEESRQTIKWRVKSSDSPGNWVKGAVTINSASDFRVSFLAEWKTGQSPVISLKNAEVKNEHCEISPSWASDHGPSIETTSLPLMTTTKPTSSSPLMTTTKPTSSAEGYKYQSGTMRILLFGIAVSFYSFLFLWD